MTDRDWCHVLLMALKVRKGWPAREKEVLRVFGQIRASEQRRTYEALREAVGVLEKPDTAPPRPCPIEGCDCMTGERRFRCAVLAGDLCVRGGDDCTNAGRCLEAKETCERHADCDAADREAQGKTGDRADHGPAVKPDAEKEMEAARYKMRAAKR